MTALLIVLGCVAVAEGLLLALFPGRVEDILRMIAAMPVETRRVLGLGALAFGVALIWAAGGLPA